VLLEGDKLEEDGEHLLPPGEGTKATSPVL